MEQGGNRMRSIDRRWWFLGSLVALMLVAGGPAQGATVEAMTLEEMAQRADLIFVGRSVDSRADWNAQHTRIYTYTTFEVERFLKGGAGERQVALRTWGGGGRVPGG